MSPPPSCWERFYSNEQCVLYIPSHLTSHLPRVQTKSAAEGLDVQLIVIGDTEDADCAHYEQLLRNTGALLDSVPPPRPEEVLLP